jgi:hypothetical protein
MVINGPISIIDEAVKKTFGTSDSLKGSVTAEINGAAFSPAVTGTLTSGSDPKLTITIPLPNGTESFLKTPAAGGLTAIKNALDWFGDSLSTTSTTAKIGVLEIIAEDNFSGDEIRRHVFKQDMSYNPVQVTQTTRTLAYIYTNEALTITASESGNWKQVNVTLNPGWNILEYYSFVEQTGGGAITYAYSIGYPSKPLTGWSMGLL